MPFDELNILNGATVIPIPQFFKEIGLPKDMERERIELAQDIEKVMLFIFAFIASGGSNPSDVLAERYIEAVEKYIQIDTDLEVYIRWMSEKIVEATGDTAYSTSEDRATVIGENESHTVWNYEEYLEAFNDGKEYKTWHTMRDLRVRGTHRRAEGQTVPMGDPFRVGDSLMMYPRDYSLGASAEEIVNCRCWATYW